MYGKRGAGVPKTEEQDKIDIIQGTLVKAFGVIGGYITEIEKQLIYQKLCLRLHFYNFSRHVLQQSYAPLDI